MTKFTKEQNRHRYRLHRQSRKAGFAIHAWRRMVFIAPEQGELPPPVMELKNKYRYILQPKFF